MLWQRPRESEPLTVTRPPSWSRVPGERWSRLLEGARLRRGIVYLLAAVLIIYAALTAVRLAAPPGPDDAIRVETLPGYSGAPGAEPTRVTYDAQTGSTLLEVTDADGNVKRYRVVTEDGGWRVFEAP